MTAPTLTAQQRRTVEEQQRAFLLAADVLEARIPRVARYLRPGIAWCVEALRLTAARPLPWSDYGPGCDDFDT